MTCTGANDRNQSDTVLSGTLIGCRCGGIYTRPYNGVVRCATAFAQDQEFNLRRSLSSSRMSKEMSATEHDDLMRHCALFQTGETGAMAVGVSRPCGRVVAPETA